MATSEDQSVAPSMANGAQIPLDDFNIPQFPREAGGLMALTLTSQIRPDQYGHILNQPWKVTHLPPSIQSLTLESFILGYPVGFLKALIAELPELRSLIVYSQSFTASSDEAIEDAVAFIRGATKLRALHLLDAFLAPTFVQTIAPILESLERPLMFVEINYTYKAADEIFLDRIPARELPSLIHQGLISCTFNLAAPEESAGDDLMGEISLDGIQTLDSNFSEALVSALSKDSSSPKVMKHLNTTLYTISTDQLKSLVAKHKGLMVLNFSIAVANDNKWKTEVFNALTGAQNLEQVEIVLCPTHEVGELEISIDEQRLAGLSKVCKKLTNFKINQRRCFATKPSVEASVVTGKWKIQLKIPRAKSEAGEMSKRKPVSNEDSKSCARELMLSREKHGVHGREKCLLNRQKQAVTLTEADKFINAADVVQDHVTEKPFY